MAYLTTHSPNQLSGRGLRQGITAFFRSFQQGLAAKREYERLNGMSDYALALHGLTRQDISAHIAETILR